MPAAHRIFARMERNRKTPSTLQPAWSNRPEPKHAKETCMKYLRMKHLLLATAVTTAMWLATPAWAASFFFSTGTPDGRLGTLSQPASSGAVETEAADDFILTATTSIAQATITGLIPAGTPLANIRSVE